MIDTPNTAKKESTSSASMLRTYWRMRLYEAVCKPFLLVAVEVHRRRLGFVTKTWDEYWAGVPETFRRCIHTLRKAWSEYIYSGFDPSLTRAYCEAYLEVLRSATKRENSDACSRATFLTMVLAFENFTLKYRGASSPFALATASFRSPAFLSFHCLKLRKHARNDPSLLALAVGNHGNMPILFYHYRKQRILTNTDQGLLFFLAVDLAVRQQSFRGLEAMTGRVVSEWDSRIEQRSRLLGGKILVPLLSGAARNRKQKEERALRILDIGSGVGLFTSKLVSAIVKSGVLGNRKIELSLLDILPVDSKRHFNTRALLSILARVEYISSEYLEWLHKTRLSHSFGKFDIAFLFRILHNMSEFRIGVTQPEKVNSISSGGRYRIFPHLSDYYRAILMLFPQVLGQMPGITASSVFYPRRVFNPASLLIPDGRNLIQALMQISKSVLIEDGDLSPETLVKHISQEARGDIRVYDLSRALRLSINHIYWITKSQADFPLRGEMIWPK